MKSTTWPSRNDASPDQDEVIPLTRTDVNTALPHAREFYKDKLKSSNKNYNLNNVKIVTDKHRKRNEKAARAEQKLDEFRENNDFMSSADHGAELVEGKHRAENCGEMSAVVTYYCQKLPLFRDLGRRLLDENRLPCQRVHDARQSQIMELGGARQGGLGLRSRYETGNLVRSARRDVPGDADELRGGFKAEMQQRVNERKLRLSKRLRAYVRRPRMANEMHG
jgi:hypothetical protein